MYLGKPIVR